MLALSINKEITSYLRGIAIAAVMTNHFLNYYVTEMLGGYANGIISLFFILSGTGIFYSLEKNNGINFSASLVFFYKRFIRIFPLYWLALLLASAAYGKFCPLNDFFLIPPLLYFNQLYKFLVLLIQCYLIAPLLYIFLKKLGLIKYLVAILSLFLVTYIIYLYIYLFTSLNDHLYYIIYRRFLGGHIFLFALGLAFPPILALYKPKSKNMGFLVLLFIFFFITLYYNRNQFETLGTYVAPLYIISVVVLCLYIISINPILPIKRLFVLLGNYSYSLYLFHFLYYKSFSKLGVLKAGDLPGIIITLLLLPLFVLGCVVIEKSFNKFLR